MWMGVTKVISACFWSEFDSLWMKSDDFACGHVWITNVCVHERSVDNMNEKVRMNTESKWSQTRARANRQRATSCQVARGHTPVTTFVQSGAPLGFSIDVGQHVLVA